MILEACVETYQEALTAQSNGANRIELCSHLELDGLTPDTGLIEKVCAELNIPVMVMIRPRGGNFVYSEPEIKEMEQAIEVAKNMRAAGIVFGLLTSDNRIDVANTRRLAQAASPLPVTFHKAIDAMEDPAEGVRQLLEVEEITRILTSGGKPTAIEGAAKIQEMIKVADKKIKILIAGRVTNINRDKIASMTGATELHGRRIVGELTI